MANFVRIKTPHGLVVANFDLVRAIQQDANNQKECVLVFDGEHRLIIPDGAENLLKLAEDQERKKNQ